jgi:hypothetical protein
VQQPVHADAGVVVGEVEPAEALDHIRHQRRVPAFPSSIAAIYEP